MIKHKARLEAMKIILNSVDYDGRNYSLGFDQTETVNISVQRTLQMRKSKRLIGLRFTMVTKWDLSKVIFSKRICFDFPKFFYPAIFDCISLSCNTSNFSYL